MGGVQDTISGDDDAFVVRLSATGEILLSTYLGGTARDWGQGITLDPDGNIFAMAFTNGNIGTVDSIGLLDSRDRCSVFTS